MLLTSVPLKQVRPHGRILHSLRRLCDSYALQIIIAEEKRIAERCCISGCDRFGTAGVDCL
ncbi:MAG: hypothetical protein WA604_16355, partial [Candidatus Sulfotelmatobacter sp.]